MRSNALKNCITLEKLQNDLDILKKKLFIYETLQSEKEIKAKKIKGPFRSSKELINYICCS